MCKADMSPYTSRWYAKDPRPTGNSDIEHECVNWDLIRGAFKERHVDVWKPGNIVHPIFGMCPLPPPPFVSPLFLPSNPGQLVALLANVKAGG